MEKICFICNKVLNPRDCNHIYRCAKNSSLKLSNSDLRFKQICYQYNFDFTLDYLIEKYVKEEWSLPSFKKEHGIDFSVTLFLLDYHNIKKRNNSEAAKTQVVRKKFKNTCRSRYGKENPSQVESIKNKKAATFNKHYGVDNIWKSGEYYSWLHDFMLQKYGKKSLPNRFGGMNKWWESKSDEYKKENMLRAWRGYKQWYKNLTDEQREEFNKRRGRASTHLVSIKPSKLESRIASLFSQIGINFKHQFWINRRSYDFRIVGTPLILEVNGDYWHANPIFYNSSDLISYPGGKQLAQDVWKRDEDKRILAAKYNYEVIYIWESEINVLDDDSLKLKLLKIIWEKYHENYESKKCS